MIITSDLLIFVYKMKNIVIGFLCIFASATIFNDFFTAMGLKGFYMSNFSRYLVSAFCSVSIFFLKKKDKNKSTDL